MKRSARLLLLWTGIILVATAGGLAFAFIKLVPSDVELTERLRAQAEARLGVEVEVGAAHLHLWPRPELVIEDAGTTQPQPIRIKRLVTQPSLSALLQGRLELADVEVDGAVLPQRSLGALRIRPAPQGQEATALQVAQVRFRDAIWITRNGTALEFEGRARFDTGWHLRDAEVVRPGVRPVARIALTPDGQDKWKVDLQLGGGTADGHITIKDGKEGAMVLSGELAPRNIDVAGALTAFKRHAAVQGKASGQTQLSAGGNNVSDLARSLHTRTSFSVTSATLQHIDVDQAIRSFGKDRAGQTQLQALTGQMDTQNTSEGIVVRYTGIQATGETFTAKGQGTIANRRIDGELTVDLVGGLVGVPLKVSGPLSQPQVTVARGAVAGATTGAVVGTLLLPGIGTAIGASVGAAVGKLFGDSNTKKPVAAR